MSHTTLPMADVKAPPNLRGYQYQHGDRPLEGYTIQRGAGRGGFGEVYYALSDSGREVALKLVHTYEQIELRGIGHCMNLKSPHLVTIFDVKQGEDGRPWVIMEYVAGPSLRQLLDASPSGLGTQKAAFFLREIAKGLTYLHDCGIVHRDLKPGNIFFESGYVKIGDYGLSKLISASQHSGQTVTVGTLHYMAPEIGVGKYDKSIDIYALGALLYEMLTGQVPFFGASPGEVLMKHLNAQVDTSGIEEPFATVIRKAMAKDPAQRYQSVQEMVEAVFGSEHIRNSVSHFSPESLTIVAGRVARELQAGSADQFTPSDAPASPAQCDRWMRMGNFFDRCGNRLARLGLSQFANQAPQPSAGVTLADSLPLRHKVILSIATVLLGALVAGAVGESAVYSFFVLFAVTGAMLGAMFGRHLALPALRQGELWFAQLIVGGLSTLSATIALIPLVASANEYELPHKSRLMIALGISLLVDEWWRRLAPERKARVQGVIGSAVLGLIVGAIFKGNPALLIDVLVCTTIAVGILSPWHRPIGGNSLKRPPQPLAPPRGAAQPPMPPPPVAMAVPNAVATPTVAGGALPIPPAVPPGTPRMVHRYVRIIWICLAAGFLTLGLCLLIALATADVGGGDDRALMFGIGIGSLMLAGFCLRRGRQIAFTGFWQYLFAPLIQFACVQSIILALSFAMIGNLQRNDVPFAIFFTVFPCVVLFALWYRSRLGGFMNPASPVLTSQSQVLPAPPLFSLGGVFRFGLGMIGTLLLVASLVLTLATVTNLPGLFASGALDPRMPHELNEQFGTAHWPELFRHIGAVAAIVVGLAASAFLLLSRRHAGAPHMFRAIAAMGMLFAAAIVLGRALPNWYDVMPGENPPATINMYFDMIHVPHALSAVGMFLLGGFLLLWPVRKSAA